ncbi:stage II sporulation protein M [Mucilaginibacter sp. JRF]|uniref:stage II sporulation protein M n=1 Tax=Mucilaginibacter sp. JRF TaxID=2780088 RepID=UPI00187FAC10|nr:stage II sporulation protein M [Mucilaginibacter sp. JRF]MBE9586708.1 stage II sporulation protein M [Mucilaginibacter sp. JRF]
MREALFIKQNTERWKQYELNKTKDPDELADSFISITDDLAYAKTFYPNSKTTQYLNGLASGFHQSIYRNKKEKTNRFVTFWQTELPVLFYTYRRPMLFSLAFFLVFTLIGMLSAMYDDTFVRLILGNNYVNMTNDNIAKGDPFGVYKVESSSLMFIYIAINNIYVELRMYVLGILFSLGTIYNLMLNGIMLGSFQYYFFSKGLGIQSVLVIWIHGTLEISALVLAGSAGLVMGNSLLFPKTYSRLVSLKRGAVDGLKIAIGIVPIFIVAAFLEGFVTRHTEMPVAASVAILATSLAFIIWYVILYPARVNHKLNLLQPHIDETSF